MNFDSADRRALTTLAPAKINLDLRMRGLRADGYHLLSTVFQSIALADRLTLRRRPGAFGLVCDAPKVPTDARNLAWRGAEAMAAALGTVLDGLELAIEKHVPAEAGLGGGSADAVAAARLIAAAAGRHVDGERLAAVLRPLGADVAFFAWGGTMRGEGIGDQLAALPDERPGQVLIVRPPFGVSTRDAYGWFDADGVASGGVPEHRASSAGEGPRNDLEGPVAARHPEIAAIVARLRDGGARLAAMSGSGSACFGVFALGDDLSGLTSGWPSGVDVWQTRLLSRAAYEDVTAVTR